MKNERRLERLNKALEVMSLPEKELPMRFDMCMYGEYTDDSGPPPRHCNTAGCFAGEISLHPWFRSRGLVGEWGECNDLILKGRYLCESWNAAIEKFFGITFLEANDLVDSSEGCLDSKHIRAKFTLARNKETDMGYAILPDITQANVRARLRRLIVKYS